LNDYSWQSGPYEKRTPSDQNAVDLFEGHWESKLPELYSGHKGNFMDIRLTSALKVLGGVKDKTLLEIGPFEGFHTVALEQAGASRITAVESSKENFLKCLVIKEVANLTKSSFLLGDAQKFVSQTDLLFDVSWCAGVLYHLQDPVVFLRNLLRVSESIYLWTHFYDESIQTLTNGQERHFIQGLDRAVSSDGLDFDLHARSYLIPDYESLTLGNWQGGLEDITYWMEKSQILSLIQLLGFEILSVGDDSTVNGLPCFDLVARRI
jgi:SAM-dependent methyltransferase